MVEFRYQLFLLGVIICSVDIGNVLARPSSSRVGASVAAAADSSFQRKKLQDKSELTGDPQALSAAPGSVAGDKQANEAATPDIVATTKPAPAEDDTKAAAAATTPTEITTTPPAAADNEVDPQSTVCNEARTCEECQTAAQKVQVETKGSTTCVFTSDDPTAVAIVCQVLPKDQAHVELADMCSHQKHSSQKGTQGTENEEEDDSGGGGFSFVVGLFVLAVAGVAFYRFKKGNSGFGSDGIVNDFASVMGGKRSTYHKTETAPLATASADDDEEWGWEDSSHNDLGHVEMSNKKDDEDLTMAFATSSKGLSHTSVKSSPVFSRAPPVATTSASNSGSGPSASMSAFTPSAMQISSLGVPTSSSTLAKKKPIKNQEDDLFASMGLASKPTFSAHTSISTAAKAPSKKSSALAATDLMSVDAKWADDDGDLDDLLDD